MRKSEKTGTMEIDSNPDTSADIIHDLIFFPIVLKNHRLMIYVDNVIEHLDNIVKVMGGLHHISN